MSQEISGEAVMGLEWTLLTLAYVLVITRLCIRIFQQRQKPSLSDAFLIVSVLDALGLAICDTESYKLGAMSGNSFGDETGPAALAREVTLSKFSFASNYFYDTGIYFPKLALLAFYLKLFPTTMPKLRLILYCVSGYTICCALTTCFLDTFWCGRDVSVNWSGDEDTCSTFNSLVVFQIDWTLNFSTDLMIFFLPFPLLRKLQLGRRQILGLFVTFTLGTITMAVSIGRFVSVQTTNTFNPLYIWSMAELAVAIIVVSLPSLSSLLQRRARNVAHGIKHRFHTHPTSSSASNTNTTSNFDSKSGQKSHYILSSKSGTFTSDLHLHHTGNKTTIPADHDDDDGMGSEVELNLFAKEGEKGIYRVEEVSVESHAADPEEGKGGGGQEWGKRYQERRMGAGGRVGFESTAWS